MKVILTEEQYRLFLNESLVINDVKISPENPTSGGGISLEYNGKKTTYSIKVNVKKFGVSLFNNTIAIKNIWKKGNDVWVIDNTKKMFKLDNNQINKLINSVKKNENTIYFTGTGEVGGVSGDYSATLTRV